MTLSCTCLSGGFDQPLEGRPGPLPGLGIVEQPKIEMKRKENAVELERELLGVEICLEVALVDGDPGRGGHGAHPVALGRRHRIAHRPGPVVVLPRRGDEGTAAGVDPPLFPDQPTLEHRPDPGLAARLAERRRDHVVEKAPAGGAEHLQLEVLLGVEVGEEPALGHLRRLGQPADAQPLEPDLADDRHRVLENAVSGFFALCHEHKIVRPFVFVNP